MNRPMLKFAANISTMFPEISMLDRFMEARRMGFVAVEAQNLYNLDIESLKNTKALTGMEIVLINSPPVTTDDDYAAYFGYACVPGKQTEFLASIQTSLQYAKVLDCQKIHILAGLKQGNHTNILRSTYIKNLKLAVDMIQKENRLAIIEPICSKVKPNYFLDSFDFAVECIKEVGSNSLKLLLDIYHLEMIHGNALDLIDHYYPYTGHIQVSQAPNREEPSAKGLIDYKKVFNILEAKEYIDFIGLEYSPKRSTEESLEFLQPSGYFNIVL